MILSLTLLLMFISAVFLIVYTNHLTTENEKKMKNSEIENKITKTLQL
jgi:hypothetical protein